MNVEYSPKDKKRSIQIPTSMTEDLAELTGSIIGDGHVCMNKIKSHYEISIVGHLKDDKDYLKRIEKLFEKIFGFRDAKRKILEQNNASYILVYSKAIVTFFVNTIGLKHGKKISQENLIPPPILKGSSNVKAAFLRGIADTDFCLRFKHRNDVKSPFHHEPFIEGKFGNFSLIQDLLVLTRFFGFKPYFAKTKKNYNNKTFLEYRIIISGKKNLRKWIEIIGFNNYKHTTKYDIWDIYGFCPPYTTFEERVRILNGKTKILEDYIKKHEIMALCPSG